MNHVVLLAGGTGQRMRSNIPKQYMEISGIPLFMYSFVKFANHPQIDDIVIVVSNEWKPFVEDCISGFSCQKKVYYSTPGRSRQLSVLNGLNVLASKNIEVDDLVFIHDSVRPLFPVELIDKGIQMLSNCDVVIPVVPFNDAIYQRADSCYLSSTLPRELLCAGQSPEVVKFGSFLMAHKHFSLEELNSVHGSSELALRSGMKVKLMDGAYQNIKVTTQMDLELIKVMINLSNSNEKNG